MLHTIPLHYWLILGTLMFFIGVAGYIIRRNLITILMSIELMLNAVNINFLAINRYLYPDQLHGHFFAIFVVAIAAAEASLVIALVIHIYRKFRTIDVDQVADMRF